ncbi:CoA transferase [Limnohabitans sp. Rim8]|uniref:CaiB/BaiF CoA transferase family protein n=1 Tax=Limnohabitans sp. Rim8 TaxID=1100718 RepID=UPI0033065D45
MNGPDISKLPLAGIKVIEFGQNVAGPYASSILSMLGAEVVKIERPEGGDDARGWGPPFWDGTAATFECMNHGKQGAAVDLKDPGSIAWLREYIGSCDVLVQNLRPGVMEELGLGGEELCKAFPRLIYCSLSAFGHKGPMKLRPGYEPILQAFSGIFSVNGSADGPGVRVGMQVLDLGTGIWGALGCVAALYRRQVTALGGVVDGSLLETALGWLQIMVAGFSANGVQPERHASGNSRVVVFQAFDTSDGQVLVAAANDRLWVKFAKLLGLFALAAEPRYATNAQRVELKAEIIPQLEAMLRQQSTDHWIEVLEAGGVPCSPINDIGQAVAHPQTQAMGILQAVPGSGLEVVGLPISFDGERPPLRSRAPALGQHTSLMRGVDTSA